MPQLTPLMYGAVGDGITDDTLALKQSISASQLLGEQLFIPPGCIFRVTSPLNNINENITLNIVGGNFAGMLRYGQDIRGCIKLDPNTKMFYKATISGNIQNLMFLGKENDLSTFLTIVP